MDSRHPDPNGVNHQWGIVLVYPLFAICNVAVNRQRSWNPNRAFKWPTNAADSTRTRRGEIVTLHWSTGGTKRIVPSDRIFLGKQGRDPKGVIAAGIASSSFLEDVHWEDPTKQTTYNMVDFDTILDPDSVLPRPELLQGVLGEINWGGEKGGITIHDQAATVLEDKWQDWLNEIGWESRDDPEERSVRELFGEEGKVRLESHRRRERDSSIVRAKKQSVWNDRR